MKLRNLAILLSILFLAGLTACSTTDKAEADEQTKQTEQAQTQEQADDHAAHHPEGQQAGDENMADKQQMMAKMCPMQVEGTNLQVVKLDDAVAMDFTTTGDVEELRQRVQKMAQKHEKMHAQGGMMHGGRGKMQHDKMENDKRQYGKMSEKQRKMGQKMMQMMSDVTVTTEEIDAGMRMKFAPRDAAQTDKLYQMMQKHSQMMKEKGQCPMMQMMGGPVDEQDK